eukprot:11935370-Alexandrium_andersonii.AAC.1
MGDVHVPKYAPVGRGRVATTWLREGLGRRTRASVKLLDGSSSSKATATAQQVHGCRDTRRPPWAA